MKTMAASNSKQMKISCFFQKSSKNKDKEEGQGDAVDAPSSQPATCAVNASAECNLADTSDKPVESGYRHLSQSVVTWLLIVFVCKHEEKKTLNFEKRYGYAIGNF